MTEKKPSSETSSQGRRGVLKLILAGGAAGTVAALPNTWTRPVVEAVVLPAHAQLSTLAASYQTTGTANIVPTTAPVGLVDFVVPSAVAGVRTSEDYIICITVAAGVAHVHVNLGAPHCCSLIGEGPIGGGSFALAPCGSISSAQCAVTISPDLATAHYSLLYNDGVLWSDEDDAPVQPGACILAVM